MKKFFAYSLIISVLLLSMTWTGALAEENPVAILIGKHDLVMTPNGTTHVHEFAYYESQTPFKQFYVSNGSASHSLHKYYNGVCIHCPKEGTVVVIGDPVAHTFRYTNSNEHIPGESRHKYFYECDICKYITYDILLCPGTGNGDCIIITPGVLRVAVMEAR